MTEAIRVIKPATTAAHLMERHQGGVLSEYDEGDEGATPLEHQIRGWTDPRTDSPVEECGQIP